MCPHVPVPGILWSSLQDLMSLERFLKLFLFPGFHPYAHPCPGPHVLSARVPSPHAPYPCVPSPHVLFPHVPCPCIPSAPVLSPHVLPPYVQSPHVPHPHVPTPDPVSPCAPVPVPHLPVSCLSSCPICPHPMSLSPRVLSTLSRTGDLVTDELAGLNVSKAAKEAPQLLLAHALGQVVDDQVSFAVIGHGGPWGGPIGQCCRHSWPWHRHHRHGHGDRAAARWPWGTGSLALHRAQDLLRGRMGVTIMGTAEGQGHWGHRDRETGTGNPRWWGHGVITEVKQG